MTFLIGGFFGELQKIRDNTDLDEQDMLREIEECIDRNLEEYKKSFRFNVLNPHPRQQHK